MERNSYQNVRESKNILVNEPSNPLEDYDKNLKTFCVTNLPKSGEQDRIFYPSPSLTPSMSRAPEGVCNNYLPNMSSGSGSQTTPGDMVKT